MAQYGIVQGRFLAQDGEQTPLTGRIIFYPKNVFSESGSDFLRTPITGYLNSAGEVTTKSGEQITLLFGEWRAVFLLRHNGLTVQTQPIEFTVAGDVWITHTPGGGWSFEIIPNGDGTARLIAPEITINEDGTATVRIA